ncbi:MAG: hypothetical protein MZV70_55525 [Desulfobacterales bacterium]|nr:hypothetical protein [Desulfobacterales bacterium]
MVDYESGNWSEALTTYVSDYLYKEMESPAAARDYRLQALRNYTTLVPPAKDFPLARFTEPHRHDHQGRRLRQGHDGVSHAAPGRRRGGLLGGAARRLPRTAVPADRHGTTCARRSSGDPGSSLECLLRPVGQPQGRPAHPPGAMSGATASADELEGHGPPGPGQTVLPGRIRAGPGRRRPARFTARRDSSEESDRFEVAAASEPAQIVVDPDYHFLRRLDPSEIPPTVNAPEELRRPACWSSARRPPAAGRRWRRHWPARSASGTTRSSPEAQVDRDRFNGQRRHPRGLSPHDRMAAHGRRPPCTCRKRGFPLRGRGSTAARTCFSAFSRNPYDPGRVLAVLLPTASPDAARRRRQDHPLRPLQLSYLSRRPEP